MKKTVLALAVPALLATGATQAVELYNDGSAKVSVGGRLNLAVQNKDSSTEMLNNSSRINFNFSKTITDTVSARSTLEYGLDDPQSNSGSSFFNRLAFIAFDHDSAGSISFGKQWSTYYEVAGVTDVFWVYGGNAMGIYDQSGDGRGTARANESIKYDLSTGGFNLSAQYQFEGDYSYKNDLDVTVDVARDNSYAIAASYDFDFGLNVGTAYHVTSYDSSAKDTKLWALAATYATDSIYASLAYSDIKELFDDKTSGFEGVLAYTFPNAVQLYAGFNYLDYDDSDTDEQYILGAAYYISGVRFYAEYAINDFESNGDDEDAFAVGVRYYF